MKRKVAPDSDLTLTNECDKSMGMDGPNINYLLTIIFVKKKNTTDYADCVVG